MASVAYREVFTAPPHRPVAGKASSETTPLIRQGRPHACRTLRGDGPGAGRCRPGLYLGAPGPPLPGGVRHPPGLQYRHPGADHRLALQRRDRCRQRRPHHARRRPGDDCHGRRHPADGAAAGRDWRVILAPMMYPNTGNMGLPVVLYAFGSAGFAFGITVMVTVSLFQFTVGSVMASQGNALKTLARTPPVYAIVSCLGLLLPDTSLPRWLDNCVDLLSGLTVPLMLIT